jgi:hypothetical protein
VSIEKDFASKGFDARDWLRGLKPWDQFLTFCEMFANTRGSWLWADQLSDPNHLAEFEQQYDEAQRDPKKYRPPLVGYDDLVSAMTDLRNEIRAMRGLPAVQGPETPIDVLKDRKRAISESKLDEALGY